MPGVLLIVSIGELSTAVLEAVCRASLFEHIVVASRSIEKGVARTNNAVIGAALEGFLPSVEAVAFDFNHKAAARFIRQLAPDVVFTAPSLKPWWSIAALDGAKSHRAAAVPFGGYTSLQLAPTAAFRECWAEADLKAAWVAASYPDIINPALSRSGPGPTCGVGNVSEIVAKVRLLLAREENVGLEDVEVRLVAQHALEYRAFHPEPLSESFPPHLIWAAVANEERTTRAAELLRSPFRFPYDLHFNRVTASSALEGFRALLARRPARTHLPGVLGLVGGYPVIVDGLTISLDLAPAWDFEKAIAANEACMAVEGIAALEADGTVHFTPEASSQLHALTGRHLAAVHPANAAVQANLILNALA
jgi:hypothetical protein